MRKKELKSKDLTNESSQSDIVASNLDLYQRMLDDVSDKLQKSLETIKGLESEIDELKAKIRYCKESCSSNERGSN